MRIAITAKGAGLGAWLDPRFGKCLQLVVVEDDNQFEAWPNPFRELPGGQSIPLAKQLIETGCNVVITGLLNPQTFDQLNDAGIQIYLAKGGSILELAEAVRSGAMSPARRDDVEASFDARGSECL